MNINKRDEINIDKSDVIWNYIATFFQIGAGILLLPFLLKKLPAETVGVWTIFQTITSLISLADFGFNPSFARNISYIFSGVSELKVSGIGKLRNDKGIDYKLLKGMISAMKLFYRRMAEIIFIILSIVGTIYMVYILRSYTGKKEDVIVSWFILVIINSYNLYSLYYDSLLLGKGYVKLSKQINILGQLLYLIVAVLMISLNLGLISIVSAQLLSIIIKRYLSYKVFFTKDLISSLDMVEEIDKSEILKSITPNAIKVGLTNIGGFFVNKSSIFIGSIFLTLDKIANYGITMQIIGILAGLGTVFYQSYIPALAQFRVRNDIRSLRKSYIESTLQLFLFFLVGGFFLVLYGDQALSMLKSETKLFPNTMLIIALLIAWLEKNHALAAGFLVTKNDVPFFKASLIAGFVNIFLVWIMLDKFHLGLWGMVIAPGIAQIFYQNWKWPLEVIKELSLGVKD